METTNNSRFLVKKNANEYLNGLTENDPITKSIKEMKICSPKDYEYQYLGDAEFRKYFSGNFEKAQEIIDFYPDSELFLKNIHWEKIFENSQNVMNKILDQVSKSKDKSLHIVSINTLEMVVLGEILKGSGLVNLIYSLIRQPIVNSYSKTFEALLLMLSFDKSDFFKEKVKGMVEKAKKSLGGVNLDGVYIIMDENNSYHEGNHLKINAYLKTQTGLNESKVIYKIDKFPKKDFLESKSIKNIFIYDNDNELGKSLEFYLDEIANELPKIKISNICYSIDKIESIGYYEDYLLEMDKKYADYLYGIANTTISNSAGLLVYSSKEKKKDSSSKENTNLFSGKYSKPKINARIVPFLILFPVLSLAFLISDLNGGTYYKTSGTTSSNGSSFFYSSNSVGGGSIGSSSSSSSNGSFIRSFGGGGFSKGFS